MYGERIAPTDVAAARYRIPDCFTDVVAGRRVAIVDDAINAGSATLATRDEIVRLKGTAAVAAAIFIRDPGVIALLLSHGLAVEHLVGVPFAIWEVDACPLCRAGRLLERTA